jgi:DNA-binding transcriptional LysR family regulator
MDEQYILLHGCHLRFHPARIIGGDPVFSKSKIFCATIHRMNTTRIDLNLLATLEALLAERNVTKAAARLHLSQPAVSAQLNRLRALFDDPLLIPGRRGMTPTAKALELLEPLRQGLDQVRTTLEAHRNFDPAKARLTVGIACTDYLQVAAVEPLVLRLRTRAPGMRVAIRNLDLPQVEMQMERGLIDLVFMTPGSAPQSLRSRHLFDERYVLIGRIDHPRLRRRPTVAEFAQLEQVIVSIRGGEFSTPVDDALAAFGLKRNVVLSAASFQFVPEIVSRSDFVALVPERLIRQRADVKVMEPPIPVEGFDVGMVWHECTHAHAGHRWIRAEAAKLLAVECGNE